MGCADECETGIYTSAVDVWSLGVVVYEFTYGLLSRDGHDGRKWCKEILKAANNWHSDDLLYCLL